MLVHGILYELYKHFRVGVALEVVAFALELLAKLGVVLDDTVVDDGDIARL